MSADKGRLVVTNFNPGAALSYPVSSVPLISVESAHADATDGFWLLGEVADGVRTVVHLGTNALHVFPPEEFKSRNIFNVTVAPDHGLWLVGQLRDEPTKFELGYLRKDQMRWLTSEVALPPMMYPTLTIGAGVSWVRGYAALYRGPLAATGPWEQVTNFPDTSFESALGNAAGRAGQPPSRSSVADRQYGQDGCGSGTHGR